MLLFALVLVGFPILVFLWWATGNIIAPIVWWFGSAALAAVYVGNGPVWEWTSLAVPVAVALTHVWNFDRIRRGHKLAFARGGEHNKFLATARPLLSAAPAEPEISELTPAQLGTFTMEMTRALQPLDKWDGFQVTQQFQMGATRYQLSSASWALAEAQYGYMPAFHGCLDEAQANLILKNTEPLNWTYWFWENLWGNFVWNPDPMVRDNVMLSGFMGTSIGLFEIASGDKRFNAPGSISFKWKNGKSYDYNYATICDAIVRNYGRYDLAWMPCEPNWVYSMCNLLGHTALKAHDLSHGTQYFNSLRDRFEASMEDEFLLPDGRLRVCTSSRFGFSVPSLDSMLGETSGIRTLVGLSPDKAERLWQVIRRDFIRLDPEGKINPKLLEFGWDKRHPMDYTPLPDLFPLGSMLFAAVEMGDTEVIEATTRYVDAKYGEGIAGGMVMARKGQWRDMLHAGRPAAWDEGPILADAPFPDVLVARAAATGEALDLVIYPGPGGSKPTVLRLARLRPGARYTVDTDGGEEHVAAQDGTLSFTVNPQGRTPIHIAPAA